MDAARQRMLARSRRARLSPAEQREASCRDAAEILDTAGQTLLLSKTVQAVQARTPTAFEDRLRACVDAHAVKRGLAAFGPVVEKLNLRQAHARVQKAVETLRGALRGPVADIDSSIEALSEALTALEAALEQNP